MTHHTPASNGRNRRTFIASLLAYVLLTSQLAPVAMAFNGSTKRQAPAGTNASERHTTSEASPQDAAAGSFAPVPVPLRVAAAVMAPIITATKTDAFTDVGGGRAAPGSTITYSVTITNSGPDPATNVTLTDTVDPNTTLVGGSAVSTPIAFDDSYNVVGNVRIQPNAAQGLLANDINPNTGNNTGLTASGPTSSTQGGEVAINSDGGFSYNPPPGFTGSDTFTYTVTSPNGTDTGSVTLTVGTASAVIWFINASAPAGGDGRLTNPFNCYTGTSGGALTCFSDTAVDEIGDNIFLFSGGYTGGYTLLNNEKLVGQGASASLASITGVTVEGYSDLLPSTAGASPTITTTVAATNAVPLGQGNVLRGFTVGNTTGAKIFGNNFGTLTVGHSALPDVILNGAGQALNLTNGTFAATSAFSSVATTSSSTQGITLSGIAGTAAFGSTTVSGSTTQGILIGTTTADINFGNTSITGGTDGISFQNNPSGTRTFGTITTSGNSAIGFLHGVGGGAVNVTGVTSITNPGGIGIDIDGSNANISFAATTVNKGASSGTGVDLTNNATRTIGFTSLTVTTTNAFSLNTNNSGTVNVGGGSLTQSGAGGGAASLTNTALGLTFTSVSSNGGGNGIIISGGSGTFTSGTTNLQNNAGIGILMSSSAVAANFGNTTVSSSAGDGVDLSSNTGPITFADLDITPDANLSGLDATSNTGTITSTSGDIATTGAPALNIVGPAGRTPLAMVLNNVDSTNSTTLGLNLNLVSGNLTVNDPGTAANIQGPAGIGIQVQNTGAGTVNLGDTVVNSNAGTGVFLNNNQGAVSFGSLDITPDSGQRALHATSNTGVITTTSGSITTANAVAVEIVGVSAASRTPLNVQLTTVNANGGTFGIVLSNTNTSGSPGGFNVLGNTSGICGGQVTVNAVGTAATVTAPIIADCTGGTIQNITTSGVQATNATNISLTRMNFVNANTVDGGAAGGTCDLANVSTCNGAIDLTTVSTVTLSGIRISGAEEQGIVGSSVTGFSLSNSTVQNVGNAAAENGVYFVNLFGTVAVTGSNFTGNAVTHLGALNDTAGTPLNMTVTGNVFSNNSSIGGDGVVLDTRIGTNSFVNVANNTFTANRDDHFNMVSSSTAVANLTVTANTLIGGHATPTGQGIAVRVGGPFSGTFTLDINGNSVNGAIPTAINTGFGSTTPAGIFRSTIRNNLIGTSGSALSGSAQGSCILVEANGFGNAGHASPAGTHTALVTGNTLRQCFDKGIDILAIRDGNNNMNVTVSSNNVNELTNASSRWAVRLETGSSLDDETGTVCADILNNTLFAQTQIDEMSVRARSIATLRFPGYTGGPTDTAALVSYLQGRNPAGGTATASVDPGATFNNTSPAGSACAQPPLPTLPSTATFGTDKTTGRGEIFNSAPAQEAAEPNTDSITSRPFISSPQRRSLATAAEIIPANRTASAEGNSLGLGMRSKRDGGAAFRYAAASTSAPLAQTQTRGSQDKQTKGGGGKPSAPSTTGGTQQQTGAPTKPTIHTAAPGVVVDPGVRYIPKSRPAAQPPGDPLATPPVIVGDNLTWNVGTLPAGASVTITFQVVVDNPFTVVPAQVSNQGTVTADGGINVLTDDPDVAGSNNPTITLIAVPPDLFVRDASAAEPASGSTSMIFTLALSAPAPAGGIVVNLSTANGTATGGTCLAGDDYESVSGGTATFASGEQIKTFPVTVCSDANVEGDETFFLNVNSAPGAVIVDGQGLGTITPNVPGTIIISELRTSGPGGAGDDFVEIFNNTDTTHTVPAGGYGLFKRGASCDTLPELIGTIPAGTMIPQRGHYLFVGSAYSLANYGGAGAAAGNQTLVADIESDFNVGLFSTVDPLAISTANRLDAVGFVGSAGGICDVLLEGTALPQSLGSTSEYSFVREFTLLSNDVPKPTDGNDNAADFTVVSTTPSTPVGSNAAPRLGAPGPENLAGPNLKKFSQVGAFLLDQTQPASGSRNRVRDTSPVTNGAVGTISIRRRFINNTGGAITRLRFRIYDITTFQNPVPAGTADLRALSSTSVSVSSVGDAATCASNGTPGTPPCTVTVQGTTLELPPNQPEGGGLNSSLAAGTVTLGTPLASGASITLQFLFGVQTGGSFRVFVFVEALP